MYSVNHPFLFLLQWCLILCTVLLLGILLVGVAGCYQFSNPVDPFSDNYQGYETFREGNELGTGGMENFRHRVSININNVPYAENFVDFPVMVLLNSSVITPTYLGIDPNNIRFYSQDLQNILTHEVEQWDPVGDTVIWVKIPSIPAASNALSFWCYYDYDNPTSLDPPTDNVWTDSFLGVWHLNETSGSVYGDSGPGGHDGGLVGNTQSFTQPMPSATGKIGGCQEWFVDSDGIAVPPIAAADLGPFTITFWVCLTDLTGSNNARFFDKGWTNQWGFSCRLTASDVQYKIESDLHTDPDARILDINTGVNQGNWIWFAFRWDGSFTTTSADDRTNYMNGASLWGSTGGDGTGNGVYDGDSNAYLHIGCANWNTVDGIIGKMDEVRVSSVMRSEPWIQAQYAGMMNTYLVYSPEEEVY